ncbi:hypothetical protein FKM82_011885 [Ascaphus truei]
MWRLPGLLARALCRFHASNVTVCGETEALSSTSLLPLGQNAGGKSYTFHSSGSQNGQSGEDEKKKGTFRSFSCRLPHYTALDAFGWGAAAVFFLQLARQVSFQRCAPNPSREASCPKRSYLDQILTSIPLSQNASVRSYIVPKGAEACSWDVNHVESEHSLQESDNSPESLSSASSSGSGVLHFDFEQGESQTGNTSSISTSSTSGSGSDGEEPATRPGQELEEPEGELGESLQFAASRLLEVTESSVPVVLNIIGIVSARDRADYSTAFRYFQEAAESGYSKAQYNTGVCYEQGRGVAKNVTKAAEYYLLAAKGEHRQAQYRYARCLLQSQDVSKPEDTQTALWMLQDAAQVGMQQAQAYLGVLYSRDPHLDPQKAVRYLWMAAENLDAQSRYYLGVCYERGFGVPANRREALRHYERAARAGHGLAQRRLLEMHQEQAEGQSSLSVSLRTAASSPCLTVLEKMSLLPRASNSLSTNRTNSLGLPHSLSDGNLLVMSPVDSGSYSLTAGQVRNNPLPLASLRAIGVG